METRLVDDARAILRAAMNAVALERVVPKRLLRHGRILDFPGGSCALPEQVRVASVGKAAGPMLDGFLDVLGPDPRPTESLVVQGRDGLAPGHPATIVTAGHPEPDAGSFEAARRVLDLARQAERGSLFVLLVSGGGSAMLEQPIGAAIELHDLAAFYRTLVGCGAPIGDVNAVRKTLSAIKGGRLLRACSPATCLTLIVSDVPGDDPALVASGPTIPDPDAYTRAAAVVLEYSLVAAAHASIRPWLERLLSGERPPDYRRSMVETDSNVSVLLGSADVLEAARRAAEEHGYLACVDTLADEVPVDDAARGLLDRLDAHAAAHPGRRVALIADGEVLSRVTGPGVGGRNQAFVLRCVTRIAGRPRCVLSAGTDGIDGNSPAAGAVADGDTLARARTAGLDSEAAFLASDSHGFFDALGSTIVTGATGNNLRDLRVLLASPA